MLVNNKAKVVLQNKNLTVYITSLNTHRRGKKQRNPLGEEVVHVWFCLPVNMNL